MLQQSWWGFADSNQIEEIENVQLEFRGLWSWPIWRAWAQNFSWQRGSMKEVPFSFSGLWKFSSGKAFVQKATSEHSDCHCNSLEMTYSNSISLCVYAIHFTQGKHNLRDNVCICGLPHGSAGKISACNAGTQETRVWSKIIK